MSEMKLYEQLGRDIATRREALHLTQSQLAQKIGVARATLANIESGRQRVMIHQLFKLADALELDSVAQLLPPTWDFDGTAEVPMIKGDFTPEQQVGLNSLVQLMLSTKRKKV